MPLCVLYGRNGRHGYQTVLNHTNPMKKALKHRSSDPTHKPVTMGTDVKAMYKVALFEGLVLINISENFYYLPQKCLLMM